MLHRHNWQSVQEEVLRRINAREWKPGDQIANEADLAAELGCARTTVNRALREIAKTGLLDRRRKAGTRVAAQPIAKATFDISILRQEVERRGETYKHHLIKREVAVPPRTISSEMGLTARERLLRVRALHMANETPYALEDRWIHLDVVPDAKRQSFQEISANEWLLRQVPYTHGDIRFFAQNAGESDAELLNCPVGAALFALDRLTWNKAEAVTKVRVLFSPGYQMHAPL